MSSTPTYRYLQARYPDGKLHGTTCATPEYELFYRQTMTAQGFIISSFSLDEYRELRRREQERPQGMAFPDRMESFRGYQARPVISDQLNEDLTGSLLWIWRVRAQEMAAQVRARRGFADAILFSRRLNGHAYQYAHDYLEAQLRREEITPEEAERRRAALRGPEYFKIRGPWGTDVFLDNPNFYPDQPTAAAATVSGSDLPIIGQEIVQDVVGWGHVVYTITLDGQPVPVMVGPHGSGLVRAGQWRPATPADKPAFLRSVVSKEETNQRHEVEDVSTLPPCEPAPVIEQAKATRMVSLFESLNAQEVAS